LAVKAASPTFLEDSFKFFTRKLTRKQLDVRIKEILLTQGFLKPQWLGKHHPIPQDRLDQLRQANPELLYIQYERKPDQPEATYLDLQLPKEEAITATTNLVDSLRDSDTLIVNTDS
jgi:hypothetical protein